MAVKTITNANVAHRNTGELTGVWAEKMQTPVFISCPSPLYYFLGPETHLIPAEIIGRPLQTGEKFAVGFPMVNETLSHRYESDWTTMALLVARIQDLLDRFVNWKSDRAPVSPSVVSSIESLVSNLLLRRCRIAGTVTEDGILTLETRLGPDIQLFVEVGHDGTVDASIFEPIVGIRRLDVATVSDLEAKLISSNPI